MLTQKLIFGLIGIAGLLLGGEMVVKNAKKIAHELGISDFFIGLTILSIGTSLPEIFTHILSSIRIAFYSENIQTLSGIAVGSNIGSNIIQITLITGLSGLFATIYTTKKFLKRDYIFMLSGIFILWLFALNGEISSIEGIALAVLYVFYLYYLYRVEDINSKLLKNINPKDKNHFLLRGFKLSIGLGLLIFCTNLILDSAIFITDYFQISGSLVGTLIIGVCTALPEFTTSIIGLLKKSSGISLGTLVGSNITNPLLALGLGATLSTYEVDKTIILFDLPFWFIVSALIFGLLWSGQKLRRWEAGILVAMYVVYVGFRLMI